MVLSRNDLSSLQFTEIVTNHQSNQNLKGIAFDDALSTIIARWKDGAFIAYLNQPKEAYTEAIKQ